MATEEEPGGNNPITAERDLDQVVSTGGPMPVAQAVDCLIQAARRLRPPMLGASFTSTSNR